MLDLSRPIEFDNGVACEVVPSLEHTTPGAFRVKCGCYPVRNSPGLKGGQTYEYDQLTGFFIGGDPKEFYVVRNVGPAEPEEYEGWFVA